VCWSATSRPIPHGSTAPNPVPGLPRCPGPAPHTRDFDDQVAGLVTHTSKSAVGELLRVAGLTVGSIITGVVDDARGAHDPFEGLRRIGIDEISYGRGHKYLTVVVDHDSGPLVWAAVGRDKATPRAVLRPPGPRAVCAGETGVCRCGGVDRHGSRRRTLERTGRVDQHQAASLDPRGLRVQVDRQPHRAVPGRPRRLLPAATRSSGCCVIDPRICQESLKSVPLPAIGGT